MRIVKFLQLRSNNDSLTVSQLQKRVSSPYMDTPAADCLYQTLGWPAVELVLLFDGLVGWQALLYIRN
jgi:hypothetical protein